MKKKITLVILLVCLILSTLALLNRQIETFPYGVTIKAENIFLNSAHYLIKSDNQLLNSIGVKQLYLAANLLKNPTAMSTIVVSYQLGHYFPIINSNKSIRETIEKYKSTPFKTSCSEAHKTFEEYNKQLRFDRCLWANSNKKIKQNLYVFCKQKIRQKDKEYDFPSYDTQKCIINKRCKDSKSKLEELEKHCLSEK